MLNLADLGSLMTIFFSTVTGAAAAHAQKAGLFSVILFAIGGFLLGILFAIASSKLAYRALARSSSPNGQHIGYSILYFVTPLLSVCLASAATALLTTGTLSLLK